MDIMQALVWCLNNRGIPENVKEGLLDCYNTYEKMLEILEKSIDK